MRTIILSDCHIGSKESNYRRVKQFLAFLPRCDEIVLLGDFWDLWDMSADRLAERHGDVITLLDQIRARGVKITYIIGNHDDEYWNDPVMPANIAQVINGPYDLPGHPRSIVLVHGHEFDHVYQEARWWSRILAWVNKTSRAILGISFKTFHRKTCSDCRCQKDFPDIVREIHEKAAREYRGHACLVTGHTHFPIHRPCGEMGIELVDAGDWKWSNTWVDVVDGQVTLNHFV